ncbi:RHS repeat-associated core domain-containing protein, partial [Methylobacterium sp. Leaf100]|uniref:RHS repeat-associated core domain-containing protein n=1 Tax=Methylobacterium sp. Leaf100 TaxID=1736252 RepID=UPI00138F4A3A
IAAAQVCPIRFQGQWEDFETGLSYNRFRHYDGLVAHYTSPDPIGIKGGFRTHDYTVTPTIMIDPLGLAGDRPPNLSPPGAGRRGAFPAAKRGSGIAVCCQPDSVSPNLDKIGNKQPGREYKFREKSIREDPPHNYPENPSQNRGRHFNYPAVNHYDYL